MLWCTIGKYTFIFLFPIFWRAGIRLTVFLLFFFFSPIQPLICDDFISRNKFYVAIIQCDEPHLQKTHLRRLQGYLLAALQYLKGAYKQKGNQLSTWSDSDSKRENGFKPKISEIYVRWKFFVQRVVRHWLPREQWVSHPWRSSRPGWMRP